MSTTPKNTGHIIEIHRSEGGKQQFYYLMKGANNEKMMHSEMIEGKRDVIRTTTRLARNMIKVRIVDKTAYPYETVYESDQQASLVVNLPEINLTNSKFTTVTHSVKD